VFGKALLLDIGRCPAVTGHRIGEGKSDAVPRLSLPTGLQNTVIFSRGHGHAIRTRQLR
jgi:hypothetical protein